MAAGEYVSVSFQSDTEAADLTKERLEPENFLDHEMRELTAIYVARGVEPAMAAEVARQLTSHDALGAYARDEPKITSIVSARPVRAALASAASFAVGAALPLARFMLTPERFMTVGVAARSLLFLTALGALSAKAGGAPVVPASILTLNSEAGCDSASEISPVLCKK